MQYATDATRTVQWSPRTVNRVLRMLAAFERGTLWPKSPPPLGSSAKPPIVARVTAIHDNYVEAVRLAPNATNGVWTAPSGAPTIYIARHPSTQKQFYNGLTVTDPVTATDWAFTYVGPQTRTASDGVSTVHQRCVPWYSTDANAPPITAVSCSAPVPNDGADGVIRCAFMEVGPGYWAEYTLGGS